MIRFLYSIPVLVFLACLGCDSNTVEVVSPKIEKEQLASARSGFESKLTSLGPAPQVYEESNPPRGVKEVEFASGGLILKAWLTAPPDDGNKHPAVVYLHGGWAFGGRDWQDAGQFAKAGFVVMMPMLRAENGNPGNYQGFLGEVDDAIAAGNYLTKLDFVDPENVFLVGHSVGAVNAALASMMPSEFKATAAFSGHMEIRDWPSTFPSAFIFDVSNEREISVRNPMEFTHSLQIPINLYVERDGGPLENNRVFKRQANMAGRKCDVFEVAGDHMTMVSPAAEKTIKWFESLID